ncbi:hypothetical protein ACQKM9_16560 [Viridibacillus sp. NPDC093762]
MKNFRTIKQAKKELQVYLDYNYLIKQYELKKIMQRGVQEYA